MRVASILKTLNKGALSIIVPALLICVFSFSSVLDSYGAAGPRNLPDGDITAAIETDLLQSNLVSSHLVDVTTSDGVVTLSGSVENILAKEHAADLASATMGVKSVINRLVVITPERPDSKIRSDIEAAMALDPAADSYEVRTKVIDGKVTLEGNVESWAEKRLAGRLAKGVKGVVSVNNDIMVQYEEDRPDGEIKSDIKRRLEIDVAVNEDPIEVEVNEGKVELSGTVSSSAEAIRAANDAWVDGVKTVASDFVVDWRRGNGMDRVRPKPRTDEQVRRAVLDALLFDPRVNSLKTNVRVVNGTVTLTGKVDNLAAKRAAERTAENTVGVFRVVNLLRVRPDERPSDAELAKRVLKTLERDPFLDKYDLTASAVNGKVMLNGTVNKDVDKRRAEMIAADVAGVIAVQNNISVLDKWTYKDDLEIKDNVRNQLWWSPFVDSDQVNIEVENGEVTLTGRVDTWFERRQATENALQGGAKIVWNKLRVNESRVDQFSQYDLP